MIVSGEMDKDGILVLFASDAEIVSDSTVVIAVAETFFSILECFNVLDSVKMVTFGSTDSGVGGTMTLGTNSRVETVACEGSIVLSDSVTAEIAFELSLEVKCMVIVGNDELSEALEFDVFV